MNAKIINEIIRRKDNPNDSSEPIYLRIRKAIEELILTGKVPDGYRLPSDRQLAEMLDTTPVTLSKALNELRNRGLLGRSRALGTYIKLPHADTSRIHGEKTKLVALVYDNVDGDTFRSDLFVALHKEMAKINREILFLSSANDKDIQFEQLQSILQRPNCCGCMVWSIMDSTQIRELMRMKPSDFPLIFLNSSHLDVKYDAVTYDNFQGGLEIGRSFINGGYRDFVYLGPRQRIYSDAHMNRLNGLKASLSEKNLDPEKVTVILYDEVTDIDLDELRANHRGAAVMVSYIMELLDFIAYLEKSGYRQDDLGAMASFGPQLNGTAATGIMEYDYEIKDMATIAVSLLAERLNGVKGDWKLLTVGGRLIGREFMKKAKTTKTKESICVSS